MEFKTATLDELCDVKIGRTPPRNQHQWFNSGMESDWRWVSIKDMGLCGKFINSTSETITDEAKEKFNYAAVDDGTILLSFKLTVGRVAITVGKMVTNEAIAQLPIKNESIVDRDYLYYYLKNYQWDNIGSTSSIATAVNSKTIKSLKIKFPDLETQQKIVRVLSALDSKIELNNKICVTLEKQAKIIFKNWFIDFEPFKNDGFIETDLGMIPKGWRVMPLGEIFDFRRGIALTKNDVSIKRNKDHPFVVYGAGRDVFGYSKKYTLSTPSVLIAAIGAGAGTVSRSCEEKYSVTSNAFYVLPKNEFDYPYEIFSLRNYNFKDRCSGSAQPMLSYSAFSEDRCIYPSSNILKKFHDVCSPMIKKIDKLIEQNNALSSIRDTLLPKLMNGEINLERVL